MLTPNNNNFLLESFNFLFFLKVKKKVSENASNASKRAKRFSSPTKVKMERIKERFSSNKIFLTSSNSPLPRL